MKPRRYAQIPPELLDSPGYLSLKSASAVRVLLAIWFHARAKTGECRETHEILMELAGVSRSTLYEAIDRLEAGGLITKIEGGGGRGRANTYRVNTGRGTGPFTELDQAITGRNVGPFTQAGGIRIYGELLWPAPSSEDLPHRHRSRLCSY